MADETIKPFNHLTILGGGPAGLAVGYYANLQGYIPQIIEASQRAGGNCVTLNQTHEGQEYKYDLGAHRLQSNIPEVIDLVREWLGHDLLHVTAPSKIVNDEKMLAFPLSTKELIPHFGIRKLLSSSAEILRNRYKDRKVEEYDNFEEQALSKYGKLVASQFLLNYSEKLWGISPSELSTAISGNRLSGLNFRNLVREKIMRKQAKVNHYDSTFYYPKNGYGTLIEVLKEKVGEKHISLSSKVTAIFCGDHVIKSIQINEEPTHIPINQVVSTLPLPLLLNMMIPQPPEYILDLVQNIQYRSLLLVVFFIDKDQVSENATIYYPEKKYPFTRIYEPKNRSAAMSPDGKTSLVVEIPVFETDSLWAMDDKELSQVILTHVVKTGLFQIAEFMGSKVERVKYAYPILTKQTHENIQAIKDYLLQFENLTIFGRSGTFQYIHFHNILHEAQTILTNTKEVTEMQDL